MIELATIRTAVPQAPVRELPQAGEYEFAAAVADVDKRLRAETRQRHQEQAAQLPSGQQLALPRDGRVPRPTAGARG